ncbi:MAG TPA: RNA polymerase-binding protein DksA [Gammaproteobacteria bacterium]|nr:RNA polymerase-binding protein DksA [Gammaproteobacteria bacterium]
MPGNSADLARYQGFQPYEPAPDEPYMSPEQEAHFRAMLTHWRRTLMEEVDRTVDHMKSEATQHADPNDRATQESDIGLELRTRDRERKLIAKIDGALRQLDEHEYGYCKECGVEIGLRRLEARPTADLCIDCKTAQEQQERTFG